MYAIIIICFYSIFGKTCIEDLLKSPRENFTDYISMFDYFCYSQKDQESKSLWYRYDESIMTCPEALKLLQKDTTSSLAEALPKVGIVCDSIFGDSANKALDKEQDEKDSVAALAKSESKLNNAKAEYENNKIEKSFRKNKRKITKAITACIKKYANDPPSIKIVDVSHVYGDEYEVTYRGKNGFGALMLSSALIIIDKDMACLDIKNKGEEE